MLTKLKEESTWRGIIALATAAGITIEPAMTNAIIAIGMAGIGLINVIKNQKK